MALACDGVPHQDLAEAAAVASPVEEKHEPVAAALEFPDVVIAAAFAAHGQRIREEAGEEICVF